jgi:type II secretory pathway pseudopilin PulG
MNKTGEYESGRSMVEMVGVLAVMGLITAGAFVLMRSGMATQKRNRAQDEIANIVSTVRTLSAGGEDFSNLATDGASDDAGSALLANLRISTATPFGGTSAYTVRYASGTPTQFSVKITNLARQDCNALKASAWADAVADSFGCLTVGSDTAACAADATNCDFTVSYGK